MFNRRKKLIWVWNRGAVRGGGGVRTILRARRWEGAPEGETWFLPRGTLEPCISANFFTPLGPGFDRANFQVIIQMRVGPRPVLGFSLCLYFRHPSISDEKNCRAGGNNTRPCCRGCQEWLDGVYCPAAAASASDFSAAEEFCVQMHAIG